MFLSTLRPLPFLATFLSVSSLAVSEIVPGYDGSPDVSLCPFNIFNLLTPKCTLGINIWYNVPDGSNQPASTGEYSGTSVNQVTFFDQFCQNLFTLPNFSPPTEDVVGTLSPQNYQPLTVQGTSDGSDVNPFQLSSNTKLESELLPTFQFTYDGKVHKQANNFKTDGTCSGDLCSCTGKPCKRKENGLECSGWCYSCPFDCKKTNPPSRIMRS